MQYDGPMDPKQAAHCKERGVRSNILVSTTIGAALVLTSSIPANASGYWNMPSSFSQHWGYGFGAGYHAPMILGPIRWDGWQAPNEVRLPYSPSVPYGCDGCLNCGADFAAPTLMEPAPAPAMPTTGPSARRPRELFLW